MKKSIDIISSIRLSSEPSGISIRIEKLKEIFKRNGFRIVKSKNAEVFYEETSLPKISLPLLKLLGLVSKGFNRTIEVFILAKKIA